MVNELEAWRKRETNRLAAGDMVGYHPGEPVTAEPIAMAALASIGLGLQPAADTYCRRLLFAQCPDGAVSVSLDASGPYWTTSLACIAWEQYARRWVDDRGKEYRSARDRGLSYLLGCGGEVIPRNKTISHNSELVGWPWVIGTHSWLEPTVFALLALRHAGKQSDPRAVEAGHLIVDRQLPSGGANYGNTWVLGQELRPHVMPSAMSLVAMHRVTPLPKPLEPTLRYVQSELNRPLATASLAWTIHSLMSAAWETSTGQLEFQWPMLEAIKRLEQGEPNPHRHNLLLLAMLGRESPLLNIDPWAESFEPTVTPSSTEAADESHR